MATPKQPPMERKKVAPGGHAEIAVVGVVLDREDEYLHHEAEPEADDEHVQRPRERRRRRPHRREQQEADDEDRRARDGERLVAPQRAMICPLPIEVVSRPSMSGSSCRPDEVGEDPLTTCRKSGR